MEIGINRTLYRKYDQITKDIFKHRLDVLYDGKESSINVKFQISVIKRFNSLQIV